jgi:hypothetical protein
MNNKEVFSLLNSFCELGSSKPINLEMRELIRRLELRLKKR